MDSEIFIKLIYIDEGSLTHTVYEELKTYLNTIMKAHIENERVYVKMKSNLNDILLLDCEYEIIEGDERILSKLYE